MISKKRKIKKPDRLYDRFISMLLVICLVLGMSVGLSQKIVYVVTGEESFALNSTTGMITEYNSAGGSDVIIPSILEEYLLPV